MVYKVGTSTLTIYLTHPHYIYTIYSRYIINTNTNGNFILLLDILSTGTASGDGASADLWCYDCNKAVLDEDLQLHLRGVGVDVATATKTALSLAELQLQRNKEVRLTDRHGHLPSRSYTNPVYARYILISS